MSAAINYDVPYLEQHRMTEEEEESLFHSTLGEELKRHRKAKGYTQPEFAKIVGMSFSMYSKIEQGQPTPLYSYRKIALKLGANLGDIIQTVEAIMALRAR